MIKNLDDFKAYNLAMDIGERIWGIVMRWDSFAKDTIGKQLIRATDSIAANLSEGLGRYHYKEVKNFSYYSRGSLFESRTWIAKSANRGFFTRDEFKAIDDDLTLLGKMLNGYINSIGNVNEPEANYGDMPE